MANTDKNIVITPNIGNTSDPVVVFSGANSSVGPQNISLYTYPASNGTLSFEGSAGQLFSITNDLSNSIFAVNDVSGIPSFEVFANGQINIAQFGGNIGIGNSTPSDKLSVSGTTFLQGNVTLGGSLLANGSLGIGTNSPAVKLHVSAGAVDEVARFESTGNPYISLYDTGVRQAYFYSDTSAIRLYSENSKPLYLYSTNANEVAIGSNSVTRIFVAANGNVGVGNNAPAARLHIQGGTANDAVSEVRINGSLGTIDIYNSLTGTSYNNIVQTGDKAIIYTDGTIGTGNFVIAPWVANTYGIRITANGNIGISTPTPAYTLTVNGNISTSGNAYANVLVISGSNDYIMPTTGVEGWFYANLFSVSAQDTEPRDLYFSSNGSIMYVLGNQGDDVNQYNLSTPWNITTATYTNNFVVSAQEATPTGLTFKPDGTAMYIVGTGNDTVYQYTLSTPWIITSASYASKSFSVAAEDTAPQAIEFSTDGTKMFIVGDTGDDINQYNLSTAWDVTTASFVSNFSVATYENVPQGIAFNSTGTKMYVVGTTFARIVEYNLATPWTLSTATFSDFGLISNLGTSLILGVSGIYYSEAQGKAYISDYQNDAIFQLTTNVASTEMVGTKFVFKPDVFMQNDLMVDKNGRFNGELRVIGTISGGGFSTSGTSTLNGTVNMGTTTGAINIGTGQSTGVLTLGGTGQTGAIIIGRSTVNQTLSIANGATTSGNTKTLNIATEGLAGSNTVINVGPTASNSFLTINSNNVTFSSTAAVKLPVGNTAQRPTAVTGHIRFNSDLTSFEGYNGTAWTSVGGAATGGGSDQIFIQNDQTITTNYTIPTGKNAGTFGPVTINSGVTVTVPSGSVWTVV